MGPKPAGSRMDLSRAAQAYVERLIESNGKPKILLLDDETTSILSLATSQSTLLKNDVFLIDKVANTARQKMRHLDCTVFVRPSSESVQAIIDELRVPKYAHYTLVFTSTVRKSQLERLAEADDHEAVVRVQEMFLDWRKINADLFSCGVPQIYQSTTAWRTDSLERSVEAVFAALGSLRMGQPAIRYDANSALSRKFGAQIDALLTQHASHLPAPSGTANKSLLLVLDRLNDPVTPLVTHWTYQAMVDELLGLVNNRVDLSQAPDVPPSHREVVLSEDQDAFFHDAMFLNFGDLGAAVREYVQQYSTRTKTSQQLESVADIKNFVDKLPEFKKLQSNTTKHVSLVGELSRRVSEGHLLAVSEVEQSLACNENHTPDLQNIQRLIASPDVSIYQKYRLVVLYGLRYRNHPHQVTEQLLQTLRASSGVSSRDDVDGGANDDATFSGSGGATFADTEDVVTRLDRAARTLLSIYASAGSRFPQEDLFNQGSIFMRAQQGLKGLRGVENVYTQHKALLESILAQLGGGSNGSGSGSRSRLPREKYPFLARATEADPTQILVFVVGGVTFEEARIVGEHNRRNPDLPIVLGGTSIINPKRFLNALASLG